MARLPGECNHDPDIRQKNSPAQTRSGLHHRLSGQPEAAKNIACVDDQKSVISDRLIVDRVVVGCNDDSIEILQCRLGQFDRAPPLDRHMLPCGRDLGNMRIVKFRLAAPFLDEFNEPQ